MHSNQAGQNAFCSTGASEELLTINYKRTVNQIVAQHGLSGDLARGGGYIPLFSDASSRLGSVGVFRQAARSFAAGELLRRRKNKLSGKRAEAKL